MMPGKPLIKIALLGPVKAGKTELTRAIAHGLAPSSKTTSTVAVDFTVCHDEAVNLQMWDFAGEECSEQKMNSKKEMLSFSLRDSRLLIFCFDPAVADSLTQLTRIIQKIEAIQIQTDGPQSPIPRLLVAIPRKNEERRVTRQQIESFCQEHQIQAVDSTEVDLTNGASAFTLKQWLLQKAQALVEQEEAAQAEPQAKPQEESKKQQAFCQDLQKKLERFNRFMSGDVSNAYGAAQFSESIKVGIHLMDQEKLSEAQAHFRTYEKELTESLELLKNAHYAQPTHKQIAGLFFSALAIVLSLTVVGLLITYPVYWKPNLSERKGQLAQQKGFEKVATALRFFRTPAEKAAMLLEEVEEKIAALDQAGPQKRTNG